MHEQQPAARTQSFTASRLACIQKWPGLHPHAKAAWTVLWYRAGEQAGTITLHQSEIGLALGAAHTDSSGRRALEALLKSQLIDVHERTRGTWTFYLIDPVELRQAFVRVAKPDPQPQLFENEEPPPPPLPTEDPASLPFEEASARAIRTEGHADGEEATGNEATGASASARALPPCNTQTITITDDNPICARGFSQSQDKAASARASARARSMPTPAEKLAMQSDQRAAQRAAAAGADPPTLGDVLMNEFLARKVESFDDATRRIEKEIRTVVSDPNLAESRITGPAREAAGNDPYYTGLMIALKAIAERFGSDATKARDRGRYFNKSVTNLNSRHQVGRSPGPPQVGAGGDEIPFA